MITEATTLGQLCAAVSEADGAPLGAKTKVAIIVGHNEREMGAAMPLLGGSPDDFTHEFPFWRAVAQRMLADAPKLAPAVELGVFYRCPDIGKTTPREIDQVYAEAQAWGAQLTVELHFNAASSAANYRMVMIAQAADTRTEALAKIMGASLPRLGTTQSVVIRRTTRKMNGGRALHALRAPALLLEPFFATNTVQAQQAQELGTSGWSAAILEGVAATAAELT